MFKVIFSLSWSLLLAALPACAAELELVPGFNACSYYLTPAPAAGPDAVVEFRTPGTDWQPGFAPVRDAKGKNLRGSIVNLIENTDYELRLRDAAGQILAIGTFRTLADAVPIARTIDLSTLKGPRKITARGQPNGWVKYTVPAGYTVDGDASGLDHGIEIDGAAYVIVEGVKLRGGRIHGIAIRNSQQVRIVNCDIAGWGRDGKRGRDPNAFFDAKGSLIHGDCGVYPRDSVGVVVERCFIHDPRSPSSGWQYGHPVGAYAVRAANLRQTVIRYNDFIASDERRWCDAIGSDGNFENTGGFYRDADLNGNYLALAHDDGVELDGGQMNLRFYENRIEGNYCGISTTPCQLGPSYVFRNLLIGLGDADGSWGSALKDLKSAGGAVFYFNNTICRDGSGGRVQTDRRAFVNNLMLTSESPIALVGDETNPNRDAVRNNLLHAWKKDKTPPPAGNRTERPRLITPDHGNFALDAAFAVTRPGHAIPNFTGPNAFLGALPPGGDGMMPVRPAAFVSDIGMVRFHAGTSTATVTVKVTRPNWSGPLEIRQNDSFPWFEVSPHRVDAKSGDTIAFTVTLKPDYLTRSGLHSGAFLIRQADGLSRPVSVYAIQPGTTPLIRYPDSAVLIPVGPTPDRPRAIAPGESASFRFQIKRDGEYFILFQYLVPSPSYKYDDLAFTLDQEKSRKIRRHLISDKWGWAGLSAGRSKSWIGSTTGLFPLKAGDHTLTLEGVDSLRVGAILVTPDFEFAPGNVNTLKYTGLPAE